MAKSPTRKNLTIARLARSARFYRGIQAAVARALDVTEGHVSLVVRGLRTSTRVEKALAEAVLRIQKEAA